MSGLEMELLVGLTVVLAACAFAFGVVQTRIDVRRRLERQQTKNLSLRTMRDEAPLHLRRL